MGHSNNWRTPPEVFEALGDPVFDQDVAHPANAKTYVQCLNYISERSLERDWHGFVWMNPPYGGRNGLVPWMKKFIDHGNGIALVPDRTSAPWFQGFWPHVDLALFTRKLKFIDVDGVRGKSPENGSCLAAIGSQGCAALINAKEQGFGILADTHLNRIKG